MGSQWYFIDLWMAQAMDTMDAMDTDIDLVAAANFQLSNKGWDLSMAASPLGKRKKHGDGPQPRKLVAVDPLGQLYSYKEQPPAAPAGNKDA
ncbi:hypothetical protein G7046_g3371 [Stylonectria norvegica]|nr:hypothetical protein G7046_g3371 [Stylonectria norvegica]